MLVSNDELVRSTFFSYELESLMAQLTSSSKATSKSRRRVALRVTEFGATTLPSSEI